MATPPPDTTWIGPAVIAAGVSAVVAIVGFIISNWTARSLHSARLDTDRELAERRSATELGLAERRFQYDRDLAERRNATELALAERRFQYDSDLAAWKRCSDLAEQALTNFYEARNAIRRARLRLVLDREGEKRQAKQEESNALKSLRDVYYVPVERLTRADHVCSALRTLRPAFEAYFGRTAMEPFDAISGIYTEITAAALNLIVDAKDEDIERGSTNEHDAPLLNTIGWGPGKRPDEIDQRIDEAVRAIEGVCQPVLGWRPSA